MNPVSFEIQPFFFKADIAKCAQFLHGSVFSKITCLSSSNIPHNFIIISVPNYEVENSQAWLGIISPQHLMICTYLLEASSYTQTWYCEFWWGGKWFLLGTCSSEVLSHRHRGVYGEAQKNIWAKKCVWLSLQRKEILTRVWSRCTLKTLC